MFPPDGNGNAAAKQLLGVTALAKAIGKSKGTVSKQALAGKIPVKRYNRRRRTAVRPRRGQGGRRRELEPEHAPAGDVEEVPDGERRSPIAPGASTAPRRPGCGHDRGTAGPHARPAAQAGGGRGLLVPAATLNETERRSHAVRATRSNNTSPMAPGKPTPSPPSRGTEGEWRIFLMGLVRDAFAEREQALAAETDDEFEDDDLADGGDFDAGAAAAS